MSDARTGDRPEALPTFEQRSATPRDLRTEAELRANGYDRLGQPRALLASPGGPVQLFSTAEARRLKFAMWPRENVPQVGDRGQSDGAADRAYGALARHSNPGTSAAPTPGQPSHGRLYGARPPGTRPGMLRANDLPALFERGFVILDTETTGLGPGAEVIEISAIDSSGEPLIDTKVFPRSRRVPASSTRVHGLTLAHLEGSPTWPELLPTVERLLAGRTVLAWNAPFDERMLVQTSRTWGLEAAIPRFDCAMRTYAYARGVGSGSFRLERAARVERVLASEQKHRGLADTQLVLAVLRSLLQHPATTA